MTTTINASTSAGLVSTADTSGILQLQTANTAALTIDASQNVGIGTSSPATKLQVTTASGTSSSIRINQTSNGDWQIYNPALTTNLRFYDGTADRVTFATGGNVGIGTTSPGIFGVSSGKLLNVVASTGYGFLQLQGASSQGGSIDFGDSSVRHAEIASLSGSSLAFYTNATNSGNSLTERIRIDSNGNLLVGTTNSSLTAGEGFKAIYNAGTNPYVGAVMSSSSNSQTNYHLYSTGAGAYRFYVGLAGTVYATSTTISAISDVRLKENIRDLDIGLDAVMALKPRLYDWKEGKGVNIKNARGFIAQEFEQVFPDLIDEWKDPAPEGEEPYKSVRQDLIPVLVKSIQELKQIVDAQAATIQSLTDRITALEAK